MSRHLHKGRRVSAGVLLVVGVLAALLVGTPAAPAGADAPAGQFAWFDDFGSDTVTVGPNATVTVVLGKIDFVCDTFFAAADIYVVSGDPADGATLSDVSGGKNTAIGAGGGGIFDEQIAITAPSGNLGPGTYTVVFDECQDGHFDAGIDASFVDVVNVVFPPGPLPPIDPALVGLKAQAQKTADAWRNTGYALSASAWLYNTAAKQLCKTGNLVACLYKHYQNATKSVIAAAKDAVADSRSHWQGIADDPPDSNHTVVAVPVVQPVPPDAIGENPVEDGIADVTGLAATDAALSEALLHAIERYQGADAADATQSAFKQASAARDLAESLADLAPVEAAALDDLADQIAAAPGTADADVAAWQAYRATVEASGLPAADEAELRSLGLGDADIAALEASVVEYDLTPGGSATELATLLRARADELEASVVPLTTFASDVNGLANALATNVEVDAVTPTASAGGPYTVAAGGTVGLVGTAPAPGSGGVTFAWDLDLDGAFDDATGATPTIDAPAASGTIGLRVTDSQGHTAVAYAPITVTPVGVAPTLAVTPSTGGVELGVGDSQAFSVVVTDPDGGSSVPVWTLDGAQVATGLTYNLGPLTGGQVGGHQVEVTVTDGARTRAEAIVVLVLEADADGDGYRANVDCDDDDEDVHPNRPEVLGNGIDDDCNPLTGDDDDTPIVTPDSTTTLSGTVKTLDVLANDTSPSATAITISAFQTPSAQGGTVSCSTPNCTYTPPAGFAGTDTFTYTAMSVEGRTAQGTVTVTVTSRVPTPANDGFTTSEAIGFDALANDSDPDGDRLHIVGTTNPEHGTAKCDENGGCLYDPVDGYVGPDSFTYTVEDTHGEQATATVNLNVTAASGVNRAPVPKPDVLVVQGSVPGNLNVLGNDQDPDGNALSLSTSTTPKHGTASCAGDGVCTYTAEDGFSGFDGFEYTVSDGQGGTATTAVDVRVAPAGTTIVPTVEGASTGAGDAAGTITLGNKAAWDVAVAPNPADVPQDLLGVDGTTVTLTATGPHTVDPSATELATGWTDNGDGTYTAGPDALVGSATVDTFPRPLPPISQGNGGDGHVPILVGSKVYAFFHHQFPTQATCLDRTTGKLCPGYPKYTNMYASNSNGPGAVVGTKIYTHLWPNTGGNTQSVPINMYCWDTATDQSCGVQVLDRVPGTGLGAASPPKLIGGNLYVAGATGKVYCRNATTLAPCAVPEVDAGLTPVGSSDSNRFMDAQVVGSTLFVSMRYTNEISCIDTTTMTRCAGWNPVINLGSWNLVTRHDGTGAATGVCALVGSQLKCVNTGDPATVDTYNTAGGVNEDYDATEEAEAGTRTFIPSLGYAGLRCWDWSTAAVCTGGSYDGGGFIFTGYSAYGATFDGSCVVAMGDPGRIYTVDPLGSTPCAALRTGTQRTVDLRDQRWDATIGQATWDKVEIVDTDLGELEGDPPGTLVGGDFLSLIVTVKDGETGAVLLTKEMVGTDGIIDLSGILSADHPSLSVDASSVSRDGNPAWAEGKAPKAVLRWHADPAQLHVVTKTARNCAPGSEDDAVLSAAVDGGTPVTASLDPVVPACPPVAQGASIQTPHGTPIALPFAGTDANGDDLTFAVMQAPAHGTVTGVAQGTPTYTPAYGFLGTDTLTYVALDGTFLSAEATITIEVVAGPPGPPEEVSAIGGDASARVRWLPPLFDGGAPITGYELTFTPGGTPVELTAAELSKVVEGLANNTEYTFSVRAKNVFGYGPPATSNLVKTRQPCTVPIFTDVGIDHPFCPEIKWMADNGVAKGYSDHTYRPVGVITRQAMAAFLYRLVGSPRGADPQCTEKPAADVEINMEFCGEIEWMLDEGHATGYQGGTFRPLAAVSRQAMAAFLYRVAGSPRGANPVCTVKQFTDVGVDHPFCGHIDWMVDAGITGGFNDGSFRGTQANTRQAMAAFINRFNILTGFIQD